MNCERHTFDLVEFRNRREPGREMTTTRFTKEKDETHDLSRQKDCREEQAQLLEFLSLISQLKRAKLAVSVHDGSLGCHRCRKCLEKTRLMWLAKFHVSNTTRTKDIFANLQRVCEAEEVTFCTRHPRPQSCQLQAESLRTG